LRELRIGDQCIKWVDRLRYLGVHLVGGKQLKFDISVHVVLRKVGYMVLIIVFLQKPSMFQTC